MRLTWRVCGVAAGGAVDAAIASLLCIGVVNSHSSGIGGGGFMVVYNGSAVETIDFREMAPQAATELMFANFTDCKPDAGGQGDATRCPSRLGGLAVGVPGELRGLEVAHRRHGKLPWRDVLAPVIALCRNGFLVTGTNAAAIRSSLEFIQGDPILNETFLRNGEPYTEGQRMRRPRLADTLELVAERGADAIYKGAIAERIVQLVETNVFRPGILTLADLENYRPVVRDATVTTYHGLQLFSAPPPASGAVLSLILNILELYNFSCAEGRTLLADHRIVEAMKFGYGHRTLLGDPCCGEEPGTCVNATLCTAVSAEANDMVSKQLAEALQEKISDTSTNHTPSFYGGEFDVQDTPGTTHLSVVGPGGDAASVTSTINTYFGR
jgi:gamma-glutamyltranspeptidase/glutathione hydrolase/leukotriene-C4 hydrolase